MQKDFDNLRNGVVLAELGGYGDGPYCAKHGLGAALVMMGTYIVDANFHIYAIITKIYPIKMLKNKSETFSVNSPRNNLNQSSTHEKSSQKLQTESFLFDDGHVEIVCRFAEDDLQYCPEAF